MGDDARFRVRTLRPNASFHYEGPFGPIDVEVVPAADRGRVARVAGPRVPVAELALDRALDTTRRREVLRAGLTAVVGGTGVRLHQQDKGFRRPRRTITVERPGYAPALLRLRRWDAISLERGGTPLVRRAYGRGVVSPQADPVDVAVLLLADCSGLRQDVSFG